jgi:hypothetical protein
MRSFIICTRHQLLLQCFSKEEKGVGRVELVGYMKSTNKVLAGSLKTVGPLRRLDLSGRTILNRIFKRIRRETGDWIHLVRDRFWLLALLSWVR